MVQEIGWNGDEEIQSFIKTYLVSFTAWDILVFLQHNPGFEGSADVFASILFRNEDEVMKAVSYLDGTGALDGVEKNGRVVYALSSDDAFRASLDRFAELTKERAWRMELVGRVLTRLGRDQSP